MLFGCYFKKALFITFRVCAVFKKKWSKIDRSGIQIDSKEVYLTLWCHQPHPGQSLNPQTVVEFGDQEVEWGWIFQRVFMWVPGHVGIRGNKAADRAAKKKSS